jgi:tetratricopeptide (TPR) repeat protein
VTNAIGDDHKRNNARMWIVRTFSGAGDLDTALRIVRDLPESGMYKSRALAYALGGLKRSDRLAAKRLMPSFLMMAEERSDRMNWAECMGFLAEVMTDADDVGELIKMADKLETGVTEFGDHDARRQNMFDAHVLVLFALAKAQAKSGDRGDSIATFNKAAALAGAESESLRSDRLGRLVRDRVDAGDIAGALETCELIVYEYHKAIALIHIAEVQAKMGHRDEAGALFRRAIQTAKEIKIRDNVRDRPGSSNLNASECLRTIAFVEARAGFSAEAIQTAESIIEPKWKNSALAMIAGTMAKQGQIQAAIQLAGKIDDANLKSSALQGITLGQAESGDIAGAVEWARNRTTPRARADALFGIVQAIAKRG